MTEILQKKFTCALCGGRGIQPRFLASRCLACRGYGEVKFENPAIACHSCKGKGRSPGALELACMRCKGVGVVEAEKEETANALAGPLGEITKRLQEIKKETENKTKEIRKRLMPIKPFIQEIKKETVWFKKLGNNLEETWESFWQKQPKDF